MNAKKREYACCTWGIPTTRRESIPNRVIPATPYVIGDPQNGAPVPGNDDRGIQMPLRMYSSAPSLPPTQLRSFLAVNYCRGKERWTETLRLLAHCEWRWA